MSSIDWRECVISPNETIRSAIDNLTASSKRIVLVVSPSGRLMGTISDGDIRRGILQGLELDSSLLQIMQGNPVTATPELPREDIKKLMLASKVQQIPIVNDVNELQGLHEWDNLDNAPIRNNHFVIMAGGEGKRLLPHTLQIPKPMVEVHGKPILEHIIIKARTDGFHNFVLVVHHLSQIIEDYFKDGSNLGISIQYIKEHQPLGTAGGLFGLVDGVSEPIIVSNGDVLSKLIYSDLLQFHQNLGADATMAVRQHEILNPFGVVTLQGSRIVEIEEKPTYRSFINAGIYVISPQSLRILEKDIPMRMTDFFEILRAKGEKTYAFPVHESWIDVGNSSDLLIARTGDALDK